MKKIILSFDDGRLDTYTNAYRILNKYGMRCTINVVTDFIINEGNYNCFNSANNKSMSVEQICELEKCGMEIACHGHTHGNSKEDVLENIEALKRMGIDTAKIGFSSPRSEVTERNTCGLLELLDEKVLLYIRSGTQIRREGLFYSICSYIEKITHSKRLFYFLNKRNVINNLEKVKILPSVTITKYTTINQILYMIDKIKDEGIIIFMFHSILDKNESSYNADKWCFDVGKFEKFCEILKRRDITVCTTRELFTTDIAAIKK